MRSDNPEVKEQIKAAFYSQLLKTSYNKITVKGLVAEMGMSRQNFYRYYLSKEEILLDIVDDTFDRLYQILEANIDAFDGAPDQIIDQLYNVMVPTKSIIGEVLDRGTDEVVFAHCQNFVRRVMGRMVRARGLVVTDHDFFDVLVAKVSGGGFFLVKTWSQQEADLEEEKLKALFLPILNDILSSINYMCSK